MPRLVLLTSLRHRRFRLLYGGQAVSSVGDWLDYLAVVVLITYTWERGPEALAALSIAVAVPLVLFAPVAGALADRIADRKRVLIACDLARAGLVLGYLVAPGLPVLLVLVMLKGAFGALFMPVQQSTLRAVVPEKDLLSATSLTVFTNQAAKVAGPALSGLIVAWWSVEVAFVADAATFLVSAVLLAAMDLPAREADRAPSARAERSRMRADIVEGLRFVVRTPALVVVIGSLAAALFLVLAYDTLSPLAMRELGLGESTLGYVVACVGLGAAAGTLMISQWGMKSGPFRVLGMAQLAAGAMVCGIGVGLALDVRGFAWLWMLVALGVGFAAAGIMVVFPYVLHRETPQELIGRVTATANTFPVLMQLAAPPLGALLADRYGVGFVFLTAGPALAVLGLAVWLFGRRSAARERGERREPTTGRGDSMPDDKRLEDLRAAGFEVDALTGEQLDVLSGLADDEMEVLLAVRRRLDEAVPEVEAHSTEPIIGGVLF
ncbi:MFS transporter [Streptomyces albiaxialis]|uniref:MFS transporter n=1 Tax=Streptomyces albiaxialis TaxID=329523 RepID=A0ABP5HW47_9ACTN